MEFAVRALATVRASRTDLLDDGWDEVTAVVELNDDIPSDALQGLTEFSHVEIFLVADRATDVPPGPWVRHPRGRKDWPEVGIFVQRNKDRPNRLLATVVEIVDVGERAVTVRGLDAVDGTPVVDIKPWFRWSGPRGDVRAAPWSDELGSRYY